MKQACVIGVDQNYRSRCQIRFHPKHKVVVTLSGDGIQTVGSPLEFADPRQVYCTEMEHLSAKES